MNRLSVLVACLSDPSKGPRPIRMINYCLEKGYSISVLSPLPEKRHPDINYFVIPASPLGCFPGFFRNVKKIVAAMAQSVMPTTRLKEQVIGHGHGFQRFHKALAHQGFDLLIIEDLDLLPFACAIRGEARILLDAREYYPRQRESNLFFKLFQAPYRTRFCKTYLTKCDAVVTVSPGLAKEYNQTFGIDPVIILSVPNAREMSPYKCDGHNIKLVHHGVANPNRQLEKLVSIFELLDTRFSLDLYLTGSKHVIRKLKRRSRNTPRLRILPPVSFHEIIPALAEYDIGFFYVEPVTFNLKHCLPNKLFEFIQARLAVAIGPSPDMMEIVNTYNCGFVAPEFSVSSMAKTLNRLTMGDIDKAKLNSDFASRHLTFEIEQEKLSAVFDQLFVLPSRTSTT